MILAFLNETLWSYFGVTFDPMLSRTTILYGQRTYYFNSSKAARDLGYKLLVPVPEGSKHHYNALLVYLVAGIKLIREAYENGTHYTQCPQARIEYV
jgi:hypothetical protein